MLAALRLIPKYWLENIIPDLDQPTEMTVTGMLPFRIADPSTCSCGFEEPCYTQFLFEPTVGECAAVIAQLEAPAMLAATGSLMLGRLTLGTFVVASAVK